MLNIVNIFYNLPNVNLQMSDLKVFYIHKFLNIHFVFSPVIHYSGKCTRSFLNIFLLQWYTRIKSITLQKFFKVGIITLSTDVLCFCSGFVFQGVILSLLTVFLIFKCAVTEVLASAE